jgi:hypothetical protein
MSETKETVAATEFVKRAYALRLKLGLVGTKKKVENNLVDLKSAESDLVGITKEILDSAELKAIRNHDIETRAWVRGRALPSLLGSGWYLIPVKSVKTVDEYIQGRTSERAELVGKLVDALPDLKTRSQERLAHLWVEEQFPTGAVVREKTVVAMKYRTFDTPASLKGISAAILERELAKAAQEGVALRDGAIALLRSEMAKSVKSLLAALTPGAEGKKKGIKPASLEKVKKAFELFEERNIAGDEGLSKLVAEMKELIGSKSAKELSQSVKSDAAIQGDFARIRETLAKLVSEAPSRDIDFEE